MPTLPVLDRQTLDHLTDEEVVARVLSGDKPLFELIMRRYNQRLYRVARAILRDDSEAEDVMQDAYVRAYCNLAQFAGRARFSTWLTRIAVHEALARARRGQRQEGLDPLLDSAVIRSGWPDPEQNAGNNEMKSLLEESILALPVTYRSVLIMRDIEELDTLETAECLGLSEQNVKVRLHRARALLRKELFARTGDARSEVLQFQAPRCDRVVAAVFDRIAAL